MLKIMLFCLCLFILPFHGITLISSEIDDTSMPNIKEQKPKYLYKILSVEDWNKSKNKAYVVLPKEDQEFVHFSKDDQVEKIKEKYWANVPNYVILKVNTQQLSGKLVFEANPGGTTKYYHLYKGSIPLNAVEEIKTFHSK